MSDSQSDQSENERPIKNLESEDESSDSESSSDESSDHSDGGGLLDTMAADDSDEESSDEEANENGNEYESDLGDDHFPQFGKLPIELRHRIWELFCPELRARYRVLDFIISYGTTRHPEAASAFVWTVRDGLALEDQTRNLRTVFAVNQDSRAYAKMAFPDSLRMDAGDGDATVAFNRKSDVILVNGLSFPAGRNIFHLPGFASEVKNLALGGTDILDNLSSQHVPTLLNQFTQLESFYVSVSSTDCQKSTLAWCTSDLVNHYQTQTYEKQPGLGEDLQFLWCWPDLQRHPDFARYSINRESWDSLPEPLGGTLERRGLKAWPMVAFEYERGLRRFEMLQTLGPDLGDDTDSSEEESEDDDNNGPDLDQYESDGIDDDEIVETFDDSDEEGIDLDDGSPEPARRQVQQVSDDEDEEDGAGANFSDPESDPEPEAPVQRGRKRRVVSDSDDEEEEDVQPSTKRARVVTDSDDEDEEPVSQERSNKRSRTVLSDDEDDDDEQGGVSKEQSDNSDSSSSSEDESEEESDEEDAPPPKQLSLAERLRLHRQENPVEEDSDDASSRTADEDSDDEVDDDEEERNPFMMGMADESDGEGEDYDEDDY